mgnify:CR=1 FL=1
MLKQSKTAVLNELSKILTRVHLDDVSVQILGTEQLSNIWFEASEIDEDDVDLSIDGDSICADIHQLGGRISGHSWKKVLFGEEVFDFDVDIRKGGISLTLWFQIQTKEINGMNRPLPFVTKSHIEFDNNKINISINSGNLGPIIMNAIIKVFKDLFLFALKPIMNTGTFPVIINTIIRNVVSSTGGEIKMGLLEMLLLMLPTNDIKIPDSVAISYAEIPGTEPEIKDGRIYGYFDGSIVGMR